MAFNFADYWTKPTLQYSIYVNFGINYDNKAYGQIFSQSPKDLGTVWIDDISGGNWLSRWYMNYYTAKGVTEYADAYPRTNLLRFFSPWNVLRFRRNREIFWGGIQNVGDRISSPISVDPLRSSFPTFFLNGTQVVNFVNQYPTFTTSVATYNDVIEITYDQTFRYKTAGARFWFARNTGIVQLSWRVNNQDIALSLNNPLVSTFQQVPPLTV